jgi:hypothetical protein
MNSTELGILEVLSKSPKGRQSISDIVRALKKLRGRAYYKNVYDAVKGLGEEGIIKITKAGRTSLVSLDFGSPQTIGVLSIMEIEKERAFLKKNPGKSAILHAIEALGCPAAVIRPWAGPKLNMWKLFCITERKGILADVRGIERMHNLMISPLILDGKEFKSMLESPEKNQIKDVFRDYLVVSNPEVLWRGVETASISETGALGDIENIGRGELRYNLGRFGYGGFGGKAGGGKINIESVIAACMLSGEARLVEAVPVLLAKNRVDYGLLLYLAALYDLTGMAGFLMETAAAISGDANVKRGLGLFEHYRKPLKASTGNRIAARWGISTRNSLKDFKSTMELYNA